MGQSAGQSFWEAHLSMHMCRNGFPSCAQNLELWGEAQIPRPCSCFPNVETPSSNEWNSPLGRCRLHPVRLLDHTPQCLAPSPSAL